MQKKIEDVLKIELGGDPCNICVKAYHDEVTAQSFTGCFVIVVVVINVIVVIDIIVATQFYQYFQPFPLLLQIPIS